MKTQDKTIKIIHADDHEIFRDGFKSLLDPYDHIQLAGQAANGRELVALTKKYKPDIVFTDILMPVMDGVEAADIISRNHPNTGIIVLTMFEDTESILPMIKAGARGYLLKTDSKTEVLEAIEVVSDGKVYYSAGAANTIAIMNSRDKLLGKQQMGKADLTPREKEVTILLCHQLSTKQIAAKLNIGIRTVEGFREQLLQKTGSVNTAGIIRYAIEHKIFISFSLEKNRQPGLP